MYNFIRKNQKKMMAVFGVVLMIAFIIPTTFRGSGTDPAHTVGRIGRRNISREQIERAETEWRVLMQSARLRVPPALRQQAGGAEWVPLPLGVLPEEAILRIGENPEMYFLLQEEAREMGLQPDGVEADQLFAGPDAGVEQPDGRVVTLRTYATAQPSNANFVRYAVANLVMVRNGFVRAMDAVKVSEPLSRHEVAARTQRIKLQLVEFPTKNYELAVPPPTAEQLQEQFDRYGDADPDVVTAQNPFGFGYKYPNRVKLQYTMLPRELLRQAVRASKEPYQWEVDAQRYYLKHQDEFSTTQPATTRETFALGPSQALPTTRPFEEVRQAVLDSLIEPQVDRLARQIQTEITNRLTSAYDQAAKQGTTTGPATGPADFRSFEFLQNLAQEIQQKHNILPTVASIADSFKSVADLRALPGIGQVPLLPEYATTLAEPFVPADRKDDPGVIRLYEPSRPRSDESGNIYVIRITAADPAHKPHSISEVIDDVRRDWRRAQAFELARADAARLLEAARSQGLSAAAASTQQQVITTGFFARDFDTPIEGYNLSQRAQAIFLRDAYRMVSMLAGGSAGAPVAAIELQPDSKLVVAELIAVQTGLPPDRFRMEQANYAVAMTAELSRLLADDWFSFDSVVARLNYVDDTGRRPTAKPRPGGRR